jgi:predicted PurR-regulated permease PerM
VNPSASAREPAYVRLILIGIALVALAVVLWRVSDVLVIGFGGIVLAALLRALASPLHRWSGLRERWCVLIVLALLALSVAGLIWLFGQQVTKQAADLKEQLPAAVRKLIEAAQRTDAGRALLADVRGSAGDGKTLSHVGIAATAVISGALDLVLIAFLSVYFAMEVRYYRDGALRLLPPRHRDRVRRVLDDAGDALQKWLLGQAVAMLTVGVLVGIGLALVGVPLALVLGALAALFEFVPVVGPILFSIPGLLLAFAKGPDTVVYALLVYIVVQQFEGNVLIPLIQRWAVRLPPVVGLLAVVAGGFLLGVPGVIFATPLAVVVMCLVQHLYVEDTLENGSSSPSTHCAT